MHDLFAYLLIGLFLAALRVFDGWTSSPLVVNDIPTGLNPIKVAEIYAPNASTPIEKIEERVLSWKGPISVGGGRFSMGGQIATENSLHIDMRQFVGMVYPVMDSYDRILVAAGSTWRQVIDTIDPYNRSVMVMQSYADFTVGGSLSVNCHGRYARHGAIVESVLSMHVMFADGQSRYVYPNEQLFGAIIGGYGGIALILHVELRLVENVNMFRVVEHFRADAKVDERLQEILQFHGRYPVTLYNVNIRPPVWQYSVAVLWYREDRHMFLGNNAWLNQETNRSVWSIPIPELPSGTVVTLQEYFIPRKRYKEFMADLESLSRVSFSPAILNLSIRGIHRDSNTILSWANQYGFSFVIACAHKHSLNTEIGTWTRALIEKALSYGGSFYLPYQLHATCDQFKRAYPRFKEWLAIKAKYDPNNRFRNKLWDKYMACDLS